MPAEFPNVNSAVLRKNASFKACPSEGADDANRATTNSEVTVQTLIVFLSAGLTTG